jgi:tetratricopeptide (TPR) repeat protein
MAATYSFQPQQRISARPRGQAPTPADAASKTARGAFAAGKLAEAREQAARALELDPRHGGAMETLGAVLFHQGDPEAAFQQLERALQVGFDTPSVRVNRGVLKSQAGDFAGAMAECRRALDLDPNWAEAFHLFSQATKTTPGDPIVGQLEAALRRPMANAARGTLCFAAAKILADLGDDDRAFAHLHEGNRRLRKPYDRQPLQHLVTRGRELFTQDFFAQRRGFGAASAQPVFVLGMPSSGSTLIEQILHRHPEVGSLGEFAGMQAIARRELPQLVGGDLHYPDALAQLGPDQATQLAESYLARARQQLGTLPARVIDKAPVNYQHLPLIALLFPNARIIHTARNPMDVGLSAYFRRFLQGQDWSYDLADIGFVLRREQTLMRLWAERVPLALLNVNYESLVQNPEGVARLLVAFAGLEWDEACLDPDAGAGARIYNASHYAARQPIGTGSVGKWKRYEAHLGRLQEALKRDLAPEPAGWSGPGLGG